MINLALIVNQAYKKLHFVIPKLISQRFLSITILRYSVFILLLSFKMTKTLVFTENGNGKIQKQQEHGKLQPIIIIQSVCSNNSVAVDELLFSSKLAALAIWQLIKAVKNDQTCQAFQVGQSSFQTIKLLTKQQKKTVLFIFTHMSGNVNQLNRLKTIFISQSIGLSHSYSKLKGQNRFASTR